MKPETPGPGGRKAAKLQYNAAIRRGKAAEESGEDRAALSAYLEAIEALQGSTFSPEEGEKHKKKLEKKIGKLQAKLSDSTIDSPCDGALPEGKDDDRGTDRSEERQRMDENPSSPSPLSRFQYNEDTGQCLLDSSLSLPLAQYRRLFKYQIEGILWLYRLHQKGEGGILGDEMGLGKTVQICSFVSGLLTTKKIHSVLIVAPVSVMPSWQTELETQGIVGKRLRVCDSKASASERGRAIQRVMKRGGVCLTSYGLIQHNLDRFRLFSPETDRVDEHTWDYVILDEGHKIKNPQAMITKALHQIRARYRIILTGTPIQNNLEELWSLFDFCCQRRLLGSKQSFHYRFGGKILRGRDKSATDREREAAAAATHALWEVIQPFILQRLRKEVLFERDESGIFVEGPLGQLVPSFSPFPSLEGDKEEEREKQAKREDVAPAKTEMVVWTPLSSSQEEIYRRYLDNVDLHEFLTMSRSPLAAITFLKKVCGHAALVNASSLPVSLSPSELLAGSGKLRLLVHLTQQLIRERHRTLIFSQSKKMLDIIAIVFQEKGFSFLRLDGSVGTGRDRQELVRKFNEEESINCFLLTTGVGGVGLTLTGADRVILYDPAWNPAVDSQAIGRACRIGQKKHVVAYRFITCSTVEEKMYGKQVFKDGLIKTIREKISQQRYFTRAELRDMFTLEDPSRSKLCDELNEKHESSASLQTEEQKNIRTSFQDFLDEGLCYGLSCHDLLYSEEGQEEEDVSPEAIEEILNDNGDGVTISRPHRPRSARKTSASTPDADSRSLNGEKGRENVSIPSCSDEEGRESDVEEELQGPEFDIDEEFLALETQFNHLQVDPADSYHYPQVERREESDPRRTLEERLDQVDEDRDGAETPDSREPKENNGGSPSLFDLENRHLPTPEMKKADPIKRLCSSAEACSLNRETLLEAGIRQQLSPCLCLISPERMKRYAALCAEGKENESEGQTLLALESYLQAIQQYDGNLTDHQRVKDLATRVKLL